jgi:hypothetical protein
LGIDDGIVDIGEQLELVGNARVIAVARQAVADRPLAALPVLERLDHPMFERLRPNPLVRHDAHCSLTTTPFGLSLSKACPVLGER